MSSRFPVSLLALLALAACDRETRDFQGHSLQSGNRTVAFGDNAYELAQGQRLYLWMNCGGCHSNGGGGMGPPLRDDEWRYGGSMKQMVATIMDGRPNGMPSFRDKITEEQAWQIASFVRSMSARTREDILAGRADKPASVEPPTLDERKAVRKATPQQDDATQE
jgi:cytochrome c oxidase cbb3-type subunit 3